MDGRCRTSNESLIGLDQNWPDWELLGVLKFFWNRFSCRAAIIAELTDFLDGNAAGLLE